MNALTKHLPRLALGLAMLVLGSGCQNKLKVLPNVNQLPEVRLTAAPIDTSGRYYYSYTVDWVGFDPDGRVDHYLYVIDPQKLEAGQDTPWVSTTDNEKRLFFQSTEVYKEKSGRYIGRDFHVFLIKAIDDKGAAGPYSARSFWSFTQAPEVRIENPVPPDAHVTPTLRISWSGTDPDGVFNSKPVKYKYILLSRSSEFPMDLAMSKPDSLRRYYEHHPLGAWAHWDSTSAETTQVQLTDLTPNQNYVFALIGFDEDGAYSPLFDFSTNMIELKVGFAGVLGPQITMFNEFFNYTYSGGGYCACPLAEVPIEVPGGGNNTVTFNWFAEAPPGSDIVGYRWTLDIDNVFDQTERKDELRDTKHWSQLSASTTSATVGPFRGGEVHFFYIEAVDNNNLRSLGIIRLTAVEPTFERPLLVVDDTRLQVDTKFPREPCVEPPSGSWPTRAEMDTFLFARGNGPWQCYPAPDPNNPPRPLPGIFNGYDFDTLGTRVGRFDLTVPLSTLGRYRHVMWMVDGVSGQQKGQGTDPVKPMAALRWMGLPGHPNTLAAYVKQGGKVWLTGGGAGNAVSDGFNDVSNDRPPISQTKTYSSVSSTKNELGPGRFMYDLAKWQSEFRIFRPNVTAGRTNGIHKALGRYRNSPSIYDQAPGIPEVLEPKAPDTDPISVEAPTRSEGDFYQTGLDIEFLQLENHILEDTNPDPDTTFEESTLDTVYRVSTATLPDPGAFHIDPKTGQNDAPEYLQANPKFVLMTYYHGPAPQRQTFLMTGFGLWFFKRQQCQQLLDFVLHNIWGLEKTAAPPTRAISARPVVAAPVRPLPGGAMRRAVPLGGVKSYLPKYPRD